MPTYYATPYGRISPDPTAAIIAAILESKRVSLAPWQMKGRKE
jgi:hypothetical protein